MVAFYNLGAGASQRIEVAVQMVIAMPTSFPNFTFTAEERQRLRFVSPMHFSNRRKRDS
jgi:hypothetical protein